MVNCNKIFFSLAILFFAFHCHAQTYLKGSVKDSQNAPLPYANIIVKPENNSSIYTFAHSDDDGNYQIKMDTTGNFNLIFSMLGYEKKILPFQITDEKEIVNNIILESELVELKEVVVEVDRAVKIKKDTIVFDAESFKDGSEQVVEDLLKNIPGLNIDSDGTIKVGNKEVEKVMVEGDDFFEKGYKLLTKNMPSDPIDKIELLQNYSNNSLLKGIEESDKVALNLVLDENAKSQWFGNVNAGLGASDELRHEGTGNLMNFASKNKHYFITSFNNTGYDAVGELDLILKPWQLDEVGNVGDDQLVYNLINISPTHLNFDKSRTNFNNAKLLSINSIFNPVEKLKIKTIGFVNLDKNNFYENNIYDYRANETGFINIENHQSENKKGIGFGKITAVYEFSKNAILEYESKLNYGNENLKLETDFNNDDLVQNLITDNRLIDQKISYGQKLNANRTLFVTARYISEKSPQSFNINKFFYKDLFQHDTLVNSIEQYSQNKVQFGAVEAHLFNKQKNGNLLEIKLGDKFRVDNLTTSFSLKRNENILEKPLGYQNNIDLTSNDLYFKSKYYLKIGTLALVGNLDFHQILNELKPIDAHTISNSSFYVNPSIGFRYKISKDNFLSSTYNFKISNSKIMDVYDQFALTGFRSFSRGTGQNDLLNFSSLIVNHQYGDWGDDFFMNTSFMFNKSHDFFANKIFVKSEFAESQKLIFKDQTLLSFSSKIDRYFKVLTSNLKLKMAYFETNHKNIINELEAKVKTSNIEYGLEFRTAFYRKINFHLGTEWSNNKIKSSFRDSYTNNLTFLNIIFSLNKKLNIELMSERYYFGNLDKNNNEYYFLDLNMKYVVQDNKLAFSLFGKNLLNNKKFKSFYLSDVGSSKNEYSLLAAYLLLKVNYRF